MAVGNVIKIMKEIHPESIILVKVGTFYHCYARDAYIISYLFGYQIKNIEVNLSTTGFPKTALNKVIKNLEDKNISYIIVNKSDNYEVEDELDFKSKNSYMDIYNKSHKYISKKNKIDSIYNYLLENINNVDIKEKINKVEDILYEI